MLHVSVANYTDIDQGEHRFSLLGLFRVVRKVAG